MHATNVTVNFQVKMGYQNMRVCDSHVINVISNQSGFPILKGTQNLFIMALNCVVNIVAIKRRTPEIS